MPIEIAVRQVELLFEERELGLVGFGEHRHDSETHPLVDDVVELFGRVGHVVP